MVKKILKFFLKGDFKSVTTIKRIDATDIIIAGAYRSILIFKYDDASNRIKNLKIFSNLFQDELILDLKFYENIIYYIGEKGMELGVVEFNTKVDMIKFQKEGNC